MCDWLRSCYRTLVRMSPDPAAPLVEIQWYFIDDAAHPRALPYYTRFASGNWAADKTCPQAWPGVGEDSPFPKDRPYLKGVRPFPPGGGALPCGTEAQWGGNITWPWTPIAVNPNGTPICCLAKPRGVLSARSSLTSVVFQNPPCWPCPHPLPKKLSATPSGWNPAWTIPAVNLNQPFILKRITTTTPCFWTARIFKSVVEQLTGTFQLVDVLVSAFTQFIAGHWIWGWDIQLVQHNSPFLVLVTWGGFGPLSADCCTLTSVPFQGTSPGGMPPMGPIGLMCAGGPDTTVSDRLSGMGSLSSVIHYRPAVLFDRLAGIGSLDSIVSYFKPAGHYNVTDTLTGIGSLDSAISYFKPPPNYSFADGLPSLGSISSVITYP